MMQHRHVLGAMIALVTMLAAAMPAAAQDPDELQNVQQELEASRKAAEALEKKADKLSKEVADLQASLIKAAANVQKREREVSEIENTLASLTETEAEKAAALRRGRADLSATLVALQRLSTMPRQALLFSDESPIDMARSARLLGIVTPALDARARLLQSELNDIQSLREEMALRRDDLTAALADLAGENQRLAALVAKKSGQQKSTLAETGATKQRLARLADQAKNLQDLISRLEKTEITAPASLASDPEAPAPAATPEDAETATEQTAALAPATPMRDKKPADLRAFPKNLARLTSPASGPVVQNFGAKTDTAGTMKGVEIETRPGAQIVATFDGQIVFEGPFRGYGQILIIEHGGGYHTVLAGLDRVVVQVGQWLKAGEPIGRMGASGRAEDGTESGRPRLYVELRRDGEPIDPAPMLAAQN
jgi:septal ring factor EnvC (AmiA/AmiB activator)